MDYLKTWLNERGITDSIISKAKITFNPGNYHPIIIPILDIEGKVIFNKYRKNPHLKDESIPKYLYDKGSHATLYGANFCRLSKWVVYCEGEFDCLLLLSMGIPAVTSTSGAGKFPDNWENFFKHKEVFICLDNDDAGVKGTYNVLKHIPHAKIIWLPEFVGYKGDITNYFITHLRTKEEFEKLMSEAKTEILPPEDISNDRKDIKKSKDMIDSLMQRAREIRKTYADDKHIQFLKEIWMQHLADQVKSIQKKRFRVTSSDKLQRAKSVPISQYLKFNRNNSRPCIWHQDTAPSLHYYEKENRLYCFGCSKSADVIDVVCQLYNCNVAQAIKIILGE